LKVSIIFGTRPEVIKLASVIQLFQQQDVLEVNVCFTGQHKEMVLPLLHFFEIKVDTSLNLMQPNQTLAGLSARSISGLDNYLNEISPDIVIVQGDTTTAMCAAITSFYRKIKLAHVEAGLRTDNIYSPFPEEFNRQVISKISNLHFAPTPIAKQNLLNENIDEKTISVTGNTVIDALLFTQQKVNSNPSRYLQKYPWDENKNPIVLITGHRRENFGTGFQNICGAIKELAKKYSNYNFVYPVHLNPNVQEPVKQLLSALDNVYLIRPVDYIQFISLMTKSYLILTDSGGVQEEAPSLGKPVLIMRDTTERLEAIQAGAAKLVGTKKSDIVDNTIELLENKILYQKMSTISNPFGTGKAAEKIVTTIINYLSFL
jgi:UDP-N-acetylglucosamine 2-epimerase (non-hydrolysing)